MKEILDFLDSQAIVVITVTAVLVSLSRLILSYLEREKETKSLIERIKDIKKESIEVQIKGATKDANKQKELIELFRKEIELKTDDIRQSLAEEQKLVSDPHIFRFNQLTMKFDLIRNRLIKEINSLTKRANLNLTIGIISSIIAIGFLFYSGWYAKTDFEEKWFNFFTFFLPKFSLLVFLGTFSFYFLNLYKSNLNVIQNYQHELNNVEFRFVSLMSIILSEAPEKENSLKELVTLITNSTWNKTIKKDETTVEIEKLKVDNSFDKSMVDKIWTAFNLYDKINSENKNTTPNNG